MHPSDIEHMDSLGLVLLTQLTGICCKDCCDEPPADLTEDYCEDCGTPYACLERDGETLCPDCRF